MSVYVHFSMERKNGGRGMNVFSGDCFWILFEKKGNEQGERDFCLLGIYHDQK